METLRSVRERRGLSQRELSRRAGLSFRGVQLLESRDHDPRLSSLTKLAEAFGHPGSGVRRAVERFLREDPASAFCASLRILEDGRESWRVHLFDFVDRFRAGPSPTLVCTPVVSELDPQVAALLASTADTLCAEQGWDEPPWSAMVPPLQRPCFVAGVENLKASALVESPVRFRRRNLFVLANFLSRA